VTGRLPNYPAPQVVVRHRRAARAGVTIMRCYFLRESYIVGVAMLPPGLSVRDAISRGSVIGAASY
jgi:hypothetical protein